MIDLDATDWNQICANVTTIATPIFQIPLRTPVKSAILSSLFEIEAAKYYTAKGEKVISSVNDTQPDLFFESTSTPVEIKVTKLSKSIKFRGNKVSKRESQFVMIIWDQIESGLKYYATTVYLKPSDWSKECANYNASFLQYESIQNRVKDLIGTRMTLKEYHARSV